MLTLPSTIQAAIVILARQILPEFVPEASKSVSDLCQSLGCSKSQAYEQLNRLQESVGNLSKPNGRPRTAEPSRDDQLCLLRAIRDFLMMNPGVVEGSGSRLIYHDDFRRFVLQQMVEGAPGANLTIEQLSDIAGVPLGTLKSWLFSGPDRPERKSTLSPMEPVPDGSSEELPDIEVADPQVAVIIREFRCWKGKFKSFCNHLRKHHRIPFKYTFISSILEAAGMRRRRIKQTSPPWSEETFKTLFPGFQWIGDGKTLVVEVAGELLAFNIEAIIDPAADAIVGIRATDVENEAAVIEAFQQGKKTTGNPPLVITLDNKPCNHTKTVEDFVAPAQLLPSTPGRPTAKAPIEGAFGLFSQTAPELIIGGETKREVGRSMLQLILLFWAHARNGKPRRKLGGRTPADVYLSSSPSPEDIENAKAYILELKRRQEIARLTREGRSDPVRRQIIEESLRDLNIDDPQNRLAVSLASYSTDAILQGIATFKAKKELGTIPKDADPGRYLAGIIRNLHNKREQELVGDHLLELRLRHKELSLAPLVDKEILLREIHETSELPLCFVDKALGADAYLDFRFWMNNAKKAMSSLVAPQADALFHHLTRRISCSFATAHDRRLDIINALTEGVALAPG